MQNLLSKIKAIKIPPFLRKKRVYIPLLVFLVVIGGYFIFRGNGKVGFETQIVGPGSVTLVVSETGSVEAKQDISLSFARGGRVSRILVKKGDIIWQGQTLAFLETGSLNAELRQAMAALELEKASVEKTDVTYQNSRLALSNALTNAFIVADDAVQAKADQLFKNPSSSNPSFGIDITKGSTIYFIGATSDKTTLIDESRSNVEEKLTELEKIIFDITPSNIEQASLAVEKTLQSTQELLTLIASALNEYVASDTTVQTVYEGYKADIYSARSSVSTALSTLRSALQSYYTAKASVETSGDTASSTIKLRDIQIESAMAQVAGIQSNINDAYITSPLNGLVTEVFTNEGEGIGATAPAISVISNDNLEITVNIPEDDIAFVNVSDSAKITFDAYDNASFDARVIFVSPSAEVIDGVPVFEVILQFKEKDARIRAGLSVDVDVTAEEKIDVIAVPSRSVIEEGGTRYVRVMVDNNSFKRQPVTLGLRGDNGQTEILDGLKQGDRIITFSDNKNLETLKEIQ